MHFEVKFKKELLTLLVKGTKQGTAVGGLLEGQLLEVQLLEVQLLEW
jgi:hypothetical protein